MYKQLLGSLAVLLIASITIPSQAIEYVPGDHDYQGRQGTTYYVSKLGDNTDGKSWQTAFHKIQTALSTVPDNQGGHRVVVRPDHYMEPNLETAHQGASGSYNLLIGDIDGKLGSGSKGWVVIDAGDSDAGFKSWDWWSNMRASTKNWQSGNNKTNFSCIVWDRWALRNIYATGGDAGLFWDLTHRSGEGFTVLVEDCVGIGRAFGGGVCYPIVRQDEPSLFRRCYFMALDWYGDTAAVLIGGWEKQPVASPHVVFEDCTLVHPDNALQTSYVSRHVRTRMTDCRLIVLNFSQPHISPSTGIICSEPHPELLHIDLEDCTMAGYQVFGTGKSDKQISYTTKGDVNAYLQFQQEIPAGIRRINNWPTKLYSLIAPPEVHDGKIIFKRL